MPPSSSFPSISMLFLLHFLLLVFSVETRKLADNSSISALFVFGDSTVDTGNNNYIKTSGKGNFPPYGKDFPDHIPTGRFSNGRLLPDFWVSYEGIKEYVPPYLDPTLSLDDLKTGVNFASGGSGFDPLTAQLLGVISVQRQLKYFEEYKSRMEMYAGKERTRNLINNAIFLVSVGTNDFILNYFGAVPTRRKTYDIPAYLNYILQLAEQFIQGLLDMGARKIVFLGLPPMGCLPVIITLNSDNALTNRGCIERLSSVARDYNVLLRAKLAAMQTRGAKIIYTDIYTPIEDMIKNPQQFGFDIADRGCCGSGLVETLFLCNPHSFVCSDDSKYVFWDSIHPTQAAYHKLFQTVIPLADQFLKN